MADSYTSKDGKETRKCIEGEHVEDEVVQITVREGASDEGVVPLGFEVQLGQSGVLGE
jgi:hypothetical protein